MAQAEDPNNDTERILQAYQKDNEELRARMKELEKQVSTGEPHYKKENIELRRQLLELERYKPAITNYDELLDKYAKLVEKSQKTEMILKEEIEKLKVEKEKLDMRWDNDETQNKSIESVINSLRDAYIAGKNIDHALDNLAAIVFPSYLVKRDRESKNKQVSKPAPVSSRLNSASNEKLRQLEEENQQLREENESLKTKLASKKSNLPRPQRPQIVPPKTKELEAQVADLNKKVEDIQKEKQAMANRNKERNNKIKELQGQLQQLQDELIENKRKNSFDLAELQSERNQLQSQLKTLQTNISFQAEAEKLKTRLEIVEAENAELKKPRPTGDAALDRVIDRINKMDGQIQDRYAYLCRWATKLEDQFEEEKRELEIKHRKENEEKDQIVRRLKQQCEELIAEIEKPKKRNQH